MWGREVGDNGGMTDISKIEIKLGGSFGWMRGLEQKGRVQMNGIYMMYELCATGVIHLGRKNN